jgi:hypothetical protein
VVHCKNAGCDVKVRVVKSRGLVTWSRFRLGMIGLLQVVSAVVKKAVVTMVTWRPLR